MELIILGGRELIELVKEILAEAYNGTGRRETTLDPANLGDDELLFDFDGSGRDSLEFDSLDALEVAAALEDRFQIQLPAEIDLADLATPRGIVEMLNRQGVVAEPSAL